MMGTGGKVRVPLSESVELEKVAARLRGVTAADTESAELLQEAVALVSRLRSQVKSGYHRNPANFLAGRAVGKIGRDVHDIRYIHASDGKPYEHEFNGDVEVYAVERGDKRDLLLTHKRGLPLWDNF
ncbi:MAG: hypothetical protein ACRDRF_00685 [Pseudonocardiaceae bacterium]